MSIAGLRNLCTPALVYLLISMVVIISMFLQNFGNINTYCLGEYECDVSNTWLIFLIKLTYIIFWTWILNLMCQSGASSVAWFLVLLPFIMFFLLLAAFMVRV